MRSRCAGSSCVIYSFQAVPFGPGVRALWRCDASDPDLLPHDITFDRCYIHGTTTGYIRNLFLADATSFALIDSYLTDAHSGSESHLVSGWRERAPIRSSIII